MHEQLRQLMNNKPFAPFTILTSDGSEVTVKHPENAWLLKHFIYVTTDGGRTSERLYLLHITRLKVQESEVA